MGDTWIHGTFIGQKKRVSKCNRQCHIHPEIYPIRTRARLPQLPARATYHTPSFTPLAGLRLDPTFPPLLEQAAEEIRRRVISMFTRGGISEGGGVSTGGDGTILSPAEGGGTEEMGAGAGSRLNLASLVEMQEREVATLKHELSEALSRVPGGVEGVSALETALRNKVVKKNGPGIVTRRTTPVVFEGYSEILPIGC